MRERFKKDKEKGIL